jgi:hypothetical protein
MDLRLKQHLTPASTFGVAPAPAAEAALHGYAPELGTELRLVRRLAPAPGASSSSSPRAHRQRSSHVGRPCPLDLEGHESRGYALNIPTGTSLSLSDSKPNRLICMFIPSYPSKSEQPNTALWYRCMGHKNSLYPLFSLSYRGTCSLALCGRMVLHGSWVWRPKLVRTHNATVRNLCP